MFLKNVSIFKFFARQFPYFAQSVTPGSLCHGNNIAQMPTIRTPWYSFIFALSKYVDNGETKKNKETESIFTGFVMKYLCHKNFR